MANTFKSLVITTTLLAVLSSTFAWADDQNQPAVPVEKVGAGQLVAPNPGTSSSSASTPIERAKGEKLATAMGYYGRARALLISAVREFDKGMAIVDPNALLDSQMWRESVMERADELARVLDPQPRATKSGIRFGNETRGTGDAGKR